MNAPQVPAYLQNRQSHGIADRAAAGMGSVLPPHISIRGNGFTLIDAAGVEMPIGPMMDAAVIDVCDHMCKRYYENDWSPGSDEPPTCFSMNGVAPSREAASPQARTCGECEWNKRGSDTSRISGKPIKACRDEKLVALLLPQYPQMLFQLVIPPGSFKNWSAYTIHFKGGIDISDVLTRFGFQPGVNGVMTFAVAGYIDQGTYAAREAALSAGATDALVGRKDVPITLPAPANVAVTHPIGAAQGTGQAPPLATGALGTGVMQAAPPQFGQAAPTAVPFGATTAASGTQQAPSVGASTQAEPARRRRRTRAEIAADEAAKAAAQGGATPSPAQAAQPPQTPFPVQPNVAQPAGFGGAPANPAGFGQPAQGFGQPAAAAPAASFGIQAGAEPDPQLAALLASLNTE